MQSIDEWSPEMVAEWLETSGFPDYVAMFRDEHKIDGRCLMTLNEEDLRSPPLQLKILGDIKRLMIAIRKLQREHGHLEPQGNSNMISHNHNSHSSAHATSNSTHHGYHRLNHSNRSSFTNDIFDDINNSEDIFAPQESAMAQPEDLQPEAWKALVAMLYFFSVTWITAFVMVIVHDRVPDMQTYPPLPDIFLDNVPLIPWAFSMCEVCGLILFTLWCVILIFHKHRFILLRRMFSLFGSVFFLRCVTMLITSLSVPGRHLQCKARPNGNWVDKLQQAYLIWQGGGMSIQGVRTCGDYMFSGHTVVLTLLNFFITEYTPRSLYFVHTMSWVLNLFGIFFILAAHEHYSIDVFIAFYISTRLFLYYHTLANNRALYQGDRKRTRIWFPLFYFFESGVTGIVPNAFESPFQMIPTRASVWNCIQNSFRKQKQS